MDTLSVREYRNNLAATFDRVDNGDQVLIRRKNHIYALISVGDDELTITPKLQRRIEEARKAYKEGEYVACHNKTELESYLDLL